VNPVDLSWPDRRLSPNARVHWRDRAKASKVAKAAAYAVGLAEGWRGAAPGDGKLLVLIDAFPPDRRARDWDNVLGAMKPALDGLALALGVNDRRFVPQLVLHDDRPEARGRIRVRIRTMDQENGESSGPES
jgi:crossover junction endodeoxyribonuclease RusA